METPEAGQGLSFERAAYTTQAAGGPPCANCAGALGEHYWQWLAKPFCAVCRDRMMELFAASQSKRAFGRAVLLGGLTAIGCGIAYAFFANWKGQWALLTIGIAYLIAKVMRHASGGIGGRKYQVLAVALTYLASAMGYAPAVYKGFQSSIHEYRPASASTTPKEMPLEDSNARVTAVFLAAVMATTLVAPLLFAPSSPIGLLIVGFGLWEAWKLSRGLPLTLDGPYRAAPATGPPAG